MPKTSNRRHFPRLVRLKQNNSAYCGPAVIAMLLGFLGHPVSQERVVRAAQVRSKIARHGMNIKDLGRSVAKIVPEVEFWYKAESTVKELSLIVNRYHHPVGVEWLGKFDKYYDGEDGHYSIVIAIDRRKKLITIADPFHAFAKKDRKMPLIEFKKRWWDTNLIKTKTGSKREMRDHHMLFVITRPTRRFPKILGMKKFELK